MWRNRDRSRSRAAGSPVTPQQEIITRNGSFIATRDGSLVITRQ